MSQGALRGVIGSGVDPIQWTGMSLDCGVVRGSYPPLIPMFKGLSPPAASFEHGGFLVLKRRSNSTGDTYPMEECRRWVLYQPSIQEKIARRASSRVWKWF